MINSKSEIYEKWTEFRPIVPIREWEGSDFLLFTVFYCIRVRFAKLVEYCVPGLYVLNTL